MSDQSYGGHKEVIDNNNNHVISNNRQIVLSILPYTGNLWPKIYRTKLSEHVTIETFARENVR